MQRIVSGCAIRFNWIIRAMPFPVMHVMAGANGIPAIVAVPAAVTIIFV